MSVRRRFAEEDLPVIRLNRSTKKKTSNGSLWAKIVLGAVAVISVFYLAKPLLSGIFTKPINAPLFQHFDNDFKHEMNRFWGTYRPQVYMGMKTKSEKSLVTGLMWLKQNVHYNTGRPPIRHTCEHGDKLKKYGWVAHDGLNFGIQNIVDEGFELKTEFVKSSSGRHGGDWTWRITANPTRQKNSPILLSLFFYSATDGQGEMEPLTKSNGDETQLIAIRGKTAELGSFTIKFPQSSNQGGGRKARYHTATSRADGLHQINDALLRRMHVERDTATHMPYYFISQNDHRGDPPTATSDVIFHQVTMELPFEVEIVFESESANDQRKEQLTGWYFTEQLNKLKENFDEKFETTFPLRSKGYNEEEISFAKAAFSNMIGGIGHFYGQSLVQSPGMNGPVLYWPAHLLTAVPSRSFFPRGFLWDEGFHQMLISKWDKELSMEVIQHWLNLINHQGWIPREQILGDEARSKVPGEFVVQRSTNANPPTLFLAIESIVEGLESGSISTANINFLAKIYPRLQVWYNWFNTTQSGPVPSSYRWRGRDSNTDSELNPKTLTSGLDDYPRASHPSPDERHVDLRCWMALASSTMAKIAKILRHDADFKKYTETHQALTDPETLDRLHWNQDLGIFSDYGNHSTRVQLQLKRFHTNQGGSETRTVRVTRQEPRLRFVDSFGYISLFPLLLKQLSPDSPRLLQMLQDLPQSDLLWSEFGLRSLSKRDPLYMKRNTQHDPPYWRGQIWININYLAVRALKFYGQQPGPHRHLATELYLKLRTNLVRNLFGQYRRSGYIWEQYNDKTGQGQGTHPFTGWSALVVLIMSEQY